jgi:hypothetical protein
MKPLWVTHTWDDWMGAYLVTCSFTSRIEGHSESQVHLPVPTASVFSLPAVRHTKVKLNGPTSSHAVIQTAKS